MSLKIKTASGVKWSVVSQLVSQTTQIVTLIILAYLLSPADFGLISMAMVVIGFIGIFKDLGTSAAIIRCRDLSEELLSSIFWVNVVFGALSTVALYIFAPFIGAFYDEPRVVLILRVLAFGFLISGTSILHKALLERSFHFDKLAKLEIAAVLSGAFVSICLAFFGYGIWSLVFQSLTTATITTILLWLSSAWRPKRTFYWKEVKSIRSYSLNLTGFTIFNYFIRNVDNILIGRYLGAQDLGYYTLAYRILLFPLQNISTVIGRVTFPVFSSIQNDDLRLASAHLKITSTIAIVTFPLMMGVSVLAEPFVLAFFGYKWQPVILLVMILAPVGLIQSIGTTVGSIYQAKGRTDWMFRWGVGAGVVIAVSFVVGLNWGIIGIASAYSIASLCIFYPSFAIPFRLINLKFLSLLKVLWRPFANSLLMLMMLLIFKKILPPELSSGIVLSLSVVLGVGVYVAASWANNRERIQEVWSLVGLKKV